MITRRSFGASALALSSFMTGPPTSAFAQGAREGREVLMVVNQDDDTITFHDPRNGERLGLVRVGMHPHEAVLGPDGETAYVSLYGSGIYGNNPEPNHQIAVVSLRTMREEGRIDLGPFRAPHGLQIDPQGMLWVTVEENEGILLVEPRGRRVVAHVPTGGRNHWVALTPDGRKVYTSNKSTPWIGVIDTASRRVTKRILMPRGIENLVVSPDGGRLYAMDFALAALNVIDTGRDEVVRAVQLRSNPGIGKPPGPGRVRVSPDNSMVLVTVNATATLEIVDAGTLVVRQVVPVEASPMGVTITSDSRTAFIANLGAGTVSVVDLGVGRVVRRIEVGKGPEFVLHAILS